MTTYLGNEPVPKTWHRRSLAAGGGCKAATLRTDTSGRRDVRKLFDETEKRFGRVTGLVNNAGMNGGPSRLPDRYSVEELRRLIDTNIFGCILCAREAVTHGQERRTGRGDRQSGLGLGPAQQCRRARCTIHASKGDPELHPGAGREAIKEGCGSAASARPHRNRDEPDRAHQAHPARRADRPASLADRDRASKSFFLLSVRGFPYVTGTEVTVSSRR